MNNRARCVAALFFVVLALASTCRAAGSPRQIISLDGTWQVAEGSMDKMPERFDHEVPVPGLLDMADPAIESPGAVPDDPRDPSVRPDDPKRNAFWYRREFTVDGPVPEVAQLRVAKAKYGTMVFLNGREVGEHMPCFTPGHFDVRPYLKGHGRTNELVVRIGAAPADLPDWTWWEFDFEKVRYMPGIYDSVDLILTGTPHVANIQTVPRLENEGVEAVVEVTNSGDDDAEVPLRCRVVEVDSGRVSAVVDTSAKRIQAGQTQKIRVDIPIRDCKTWSPEHPFLYRLEVSTGPDACATRFGMRSFTTDPETGRALLNGETRYLRGTNICIFRFFEDPNRAGKPWDEEWVRKLFRRFKEMNWNSVRFCIGFPPDFWYDIADEMGIMIQDEFPIWLLGKDWPEAVTSERLAAEFTEWMRHHWNHPCVVIWDAQNETARDAVTSETIRKVRDLDLSDRPWDNGWGKPQAPGDFSECHPYRARHPAFSLGIFERESGVPNNGPRRGAGKPYLINEYAWLWLNRDGSPTELTEDVYRRQVGEESTVEERRRYYARTLAAMTEFWRGMRECAAVLHFCGLTYSRDDGYTSDNWIDLDTLEYEPYFKRYVGDAFAPVGLMIDHWKEQIIGSASGTVKVYVINDLPERWSGPVTLTLTRDGQTVWQQEKEVTAEPLKRAMPEFDFQVPSERGQYQLVAQIEGADGETIRSLRNFDVIGRKEMGLSYRKPATASSSLSDYPPQYAVDGEMQTRWSSAFDSPEWLAVDLGEVRQVSRVKLVWENAYGKAYSIEVSQDGQEWTEVFKTDNADGGVDDIEFDRVKARHVRIHGTERATPYGYSLWEFKVFE